MDHERLTKCSNEDCVSCVICDCFVCAKCGLLEGSLTSECPGMDVWNDHSDRVYNGEEDFRDDAWVSGVCSPHSPARWKREPRKEDQ